MKLNSVVTTAGRSIVPLLWQWAMNLLSKQRLDNKFGNVNPVVQHKKSRIELKHLTATALFAVLISCLGVTIVRGEPFERSKNSLPFRLNKSNPENRSLSKLIMSTENNKQLKVDTLPKNPSDPHWIKVNGKLIKSATKDIYKGSPEGSFSSGNTSQQLGSNYYSDSSRYNQESKQKEVSGSIQVFRSPRSPSDTIGKNDNIYSQELESTYQRNYKLLPEVRGAGGVKDQLRAAVIALESTDVWQKYSSMKSALDRSGIRPDQRSSLEEKLKEIEKILVKNQEWQNYQSLLKADK